MIDYLTLALTHGLIALALWRLISRPELDAEDGSGRMARQPWRKRGGGEGPRDPADD